MRFHLTLACLVASLAAPAALADPLPRLPSVEELLGPPPAPVTVHDYCVSEVERDGSRRPLVCAPAGTAPTDFESCSRATEPGPAPDASPHGRGPPRERATGPSVVPVYQVQAKL